MAGGFAGELGQLLKAHFPLLYVETRCYVETWEEGRALEAVRAVAADPDRVRTPRRTLVWSETEGLREPDAAPSPETRDPQRALDQVVAATEPTVFVLLDLHARLASIRTVGFRRRPGPRGWSLAWRFAAATRACRTLPGHLGSSNLRGKRTSAGGGPA